MSFLFPLKSSLTVESSIEGSSLDIGSVNFNNLNMAKVRPIPKIQKKEKKKQPTQLADALLGTILSATVN